MSDQLPIDGPWAIKDGESDGNIMIVRSNSGYRHLGSVPGYEYQVDIAVPLHVPGTTGPPSWEENAELLAIEDVPCPALQEEAQSLLVAIITTSGMKEFVFYTHARSR